MAINIAAVPASALQLHARRTVRSEVNPLDKSTIFSILPKEVHEVNPTIQPGVFIIPPGSYDNPSRLVVGSSSWWKDTGPDEPLLEIPVSSIQVADSVVKDYCNGYLGCDMGENVPGLFYIIGDVSLSELKGKFKHLLDKANERQNNWFRGIVKLADVLYARTNGSPIVIGDDQRMAAKILGIEREWAKKFEPVELKACPACGSMRNPRYPVCAVCKHVDQAHPLAAGLKFAV